MDSAARTPGQIGPILKSRRQERGLTQAAAAAKVGLKQATVSRVETDASRTTLETLYRLLSALDLELVFRDRRAPPATPGPRKKREW
ncbi:MAG: helix-turn-helix domain-containing protein [bacterium]